MGVSDGSSEPLVSVLMAAYNAGAYLRPAVECILNQTYQNYELLVIDDGSTDGSIDMLKGMIDDRLKVFSQANSGRPAALNRALQEIRGRYYTILDADDLCHPTRLAKQVAALDGQPEIAGVFCGYDLMINDQRVAPVRRFKNIQKSRDDIERFTMPSHDPTAMYRCSMVRDFSYSTDLPIAHAVDYTLAIGERYPLMVLEECLYTYRIHSASITKRDPAARQKEVEAVIERARVRRGFSPKDYAATIHPASKNAQRDNNLAAFFIESVLDSRRLGERMRALKTGLACARLHLFDPHYHKALLYAVAPMPLVRQLRTHPV